MTRTVEISAETAKSLGLIEDNTGKDYRIVVLHRGWVVVGKYKESGDEVIVKDASVIRRWGTTKGLGELINGPLADTVLDPCGTVRANKLAVVMTLDCDGSKW